MVFTQLLGQTHLVILQKRVVSQSMLNLPLSVLISIVLESNLLFESFLIVEVLKDGDHLVDVVPLELRSHGQIVLEHISCLGVLRVVHLESTRCCGGLLSVHAWRLRLIIGVEPGRVNW